MPEPYQPKGRAVSCKPNDASIAVWIKIGEINLLLGGDLEERTANGAWTSIVNSTERPTGSAEIFKIPHHGSVTGHCDRVWAELVQDNAYAVLTPHSRTPLPTNVDQKRICNLTQNAYVTSHLKPRASIKRSTMVEKTMREVAVSIHGSEPLTGAVQLRRTHTSPWEIKLEQPARPLANIFDI